MLQGPNYCRQLALTLPTEAAAKISSYKKFVLPDEGILLSDDGLRALDETKNLCLPFSRFALEFACPSSSSSTKRIVFVTTINGDDALEITPAFYLDAEQRWWTPGSARLPLVGYLVRPQGGGYVGVKYALALDWAGTEKALALNPIWSVLVFLNALHCSNVTISSAQRAPSRKIKLKSPVPFDSYHVLHVVSAPHALAGTGASASHGRHRREHLRRGHIRRLQSGRAVWVNAAVVCAGRGGGVIRSDYSSNPQKVGAAAMP